MTLLRIFIIQQQFNCNGLGVSSEIFPVNIGLIASYAKNESKIF